MYSVQQPEGLPGGDAEDGDLHPGEVTGCHVIADPPTSCCMFSFHRVCCQNAADCCLNSFSSAGMHHGSWRPTRIRSCWRSTRAATPSSACAATDGCTPPRPGIYALTYGHVEHKTSAPSRLWVHYTECPVFKETLCICMFHSAHPLNRFSWMCSECLNGASANLSREVLHCGYQVYLTLCGCRWFQVIRCQLCGSRGTHRKCWGLKLDARDWACSDCTEDAEETGGVS